MTRVFDSPQRGFVMLAVLLITSSALLVATGLLFMSGADGAAGVVNRRDAQSRALAWSGLQVIMQKLNEQRDSILNGASPELDDQYEIYETSSRLGVVRLLPIQGGRRLISETGKLDLNVVEAETLSATGLIESDLAEAIITYRDTTPNRPIQSVAELLNVEGVTPEILYGPLDELQVSSDEAQGLSERVEMRLDQQAVKGLADVVTVYGFTPSLQSNGYRRIQLDLDWDETLQQRCEERFGPLVEEVKTLFQDSSIKSDADFVGALIKQRVPEEDFSRLLDAFTGEAGDYRFGRVDINMAPYEVLVCLEGIEPAMADQIIRARDQLSEEERTTIAWLKQRQILSEEQFVAIADQVTTRSFVWRVRIEAGEVDEENRDGPLLNPVRYEAVLDVSESRPRLAYLREITLLQTIAQLVASGALPATDEPSDRREYPDDLDYEDSPALPSDADDELETGNSFQEPNSDSTKPTSSDNEDNAGNASETQSLTTSTTTRMGRWKRGDS